MDETLRNLQRLAAQGDKVAQSKVLAHEARLRGYPIGPWDDPKWYRDFEAGVNYILGRGLWPEDRTLYLSSSRPFRSHSEPSSPNIHLTRDTLQEWLRSHETQGYVWLRLATPLIAHGNLYNLDGFIVVFAGYSDVLWRTIFFPRGYEEDAKPEILKATKSHFRNVPVASATTESGVLYMTGF